MHTSQPRIRGALLSCLVTAALLAAGSPARADWMTVDSFDGGTLSPAYTLVGAPTPAYPVLAEAAYNGPYGLGMGAPAVGQWAYRTDIGLRQGDRIRAWVNTPVKGLAQLGFGASASGYYYVEMMTAYGTGLVMGRCGASGQNTDLGAVAAPLSLNKWYLLEAVWQPGGQITGNLYDSDGTTLVATHSATDTTWQTGGLALRGWTQSNGKAYLDTVQTDTPEPATVALMVGGAAAAAIRRRRRAR